MLSTATDFAATSKELEPLKKQAGQLSQTKEGQRYEDEFLSFIDPILNAAMDGCLENTPDTKDQHPAEFVFVVAADGRVKKFGYSTDIPFGECLGPKLKNVSKLPRPPRDSWVVIVGSSNHYHARHPKAHPPDSPQHLRGDQTTAMDKAIAPYVAKARATYPQAKKRFLAGLSAGYKFSVRLSLFDRDGKREDSFVDVEKITGANITGTINSKIGVVRGYKQGQRITFPESKIDNWVIVRPDGTEEGNYVGKFLDHYKPQ
jgi:uncharacterized protein YegJ (DUF2314 family)